MEKLKIVKVVKKDKEEKEHTYYNIYLFGVAVKSVDVKQSTKLYYLVKGYLNNEKTSD